MRAAFLAILTVAIAAAPNLQAQTRIKKPEAADFPSTLKEAQIQFENKEFSKAITALKKAIQIVIKELDKLLQSGHPKAIPQDFKLQKKNRGAAFSPFGVPGLGLNMPFIYEWRQQGGKRGYVKITITRESGLARTLSFAFKLAERDPNQEAIGYKVHKGLFKKGRGGKKFDITVPFWEKHVLQGETMNVDEELFFKIFNQAYIDFVAKCLGK